MLQRPSFSRRFCVKVWRRAVFQIDDLDMTAEIVHYSVKGIETPYIRGHIGANLDDAVRDTYVTRLVLGALGKK